MAGVDLFAQEGVDLFAEQGRDLFNSDQSHYSEPTNPDNDTTVFDVMFTSQELAEFDRKGEIGIGEAFNRQEKLDLIPYSPTE